MSPRKRLRCLRNAAWLRTKLRTKSRLYCRNAQIAQFLGSTDSRVCLQRRTRTGQRKVRLSVERLAQRCPRERVHACSSDLLYKRAKSSIRLKTISSFFARRKTASNMAHPNPVDLAAALVRVPAQNFIFLKIAGYRKCHDVVVDKNGPTMVACKRIPPNEKTRPEASRDIEKKKKRPATVFIFYFIFRFLPA